MQEREAGRRAGGDGGKQTVCNRTKTTLTYLHINKICQKYHFMNKPLNGTPDSGSAMTM